MLIADIGMLTADFGMLTAGTWYVDFSFCELFELHLVLCFFVIFANFLFFFYFLFGFVVFSYVEHGTSPETLHLAGR